jgi:hypothetical protein
LNRLPKYWPLIPPGAGIAAYAGEEKPAEHRPLCTWRVLLRWLPARGFGAAESQAD